MDHNTILKYTIGNLAIVLLLFSAILYLNSSSSSFPSRFFFFPRESLCTSSSSNSNSSPMNIGALSSPKDELESVLAKASMGNKTVIVAFVNKAYVEQDMNHEITMLDLFLTSFWLGEGTRHLLDHLVLVAVDSAAYDRCRFLRLNCFRLETDDGVNFEGEKLFMSKDFLKMMWTRTSFLLQLLKRGYNFIFTDTDVMWLRDPFTQLSHNDDLQISTDVYKGNPRLEQQAINTGFYFVRSNYKTVSLFQAWYDSKDNSTGLKEQDVLQNLIRQGIISRLGLNVRFLDNLYFSGFCHDSNDVRLVATVHANCCRSITAKLVDLTAVLREWKRFRGLNNTARANLTTGVWWSKHKECHSSWR